MSQMEATKAYKPQIRLWSLMMLYFYFNQGFNKTSYFKYAFAFAGIFDFLTQTQAIYIAIAYIISCFLVGKLWAMYFIETENEINNYFNPFQREVRDKLKLLSKAKKFK